MREGNKEYFRKQTKVLNRKLQIALQMSRYKRVFFLFPNGKEAYRLGPTHKLPYAAFQL